MSKFKKPGTQSDTRQANVGHFADVQQASDEPRLPNIGFFANEEASTITLQEDREANIGHFNIGDEDHEGPRLPNVSQFDILGEAAAPIQDSDYIANIGQFHGSGQTIIDNKDAEKYAELSKKWAIEEDFVLVENEDYSSKHYAGQAAAVVEGVEDVLEEALRVEQEVLRAEQEVQRAEEEVLRAEDHVIELVDGFDEIVEQGKADIDTHVEEVAIPAVEDATDEGLDDIEDNVENVQIPRLEEIAAELDDALRTEGYFDPALGGYPPPTEMLSPSVWFATGPGAINDVDWTEGDMLQYVPDQYDPEFTLGNYFRVAGELTGDDIGPQPIEIFDDLIMQQGKRILFKNQNNDNVQAVSLDHDGDIVIGDAFVTRAVANKIGLATPGKIYHVKSLQPDGTADEKYEVVTEEEGEVARTEELLTSLEYGSLPIDDYYATYGYVDEQNALQDVITDGHYNGEELEGEAIPEEISAQEKRRNRLEKLLGLFETSSGYKVVTRNNPNDFAPISYVDEENTIQDDIQQEYVTGKKYGPDYHYYRRNK